MYTIIVAFVGFSLICLALPAFSSIALCCVSCAVCPLVAAIILTGVRRLNSNGKICAMSTEISNVETNETFQDNASTLKALFIAQCAMHIPTVICFACSMQLSAAGDSVNASERTGLFQKLLN